MRVRGNISPNSLDIEAHPTKPGFALVWLRENISEYTETDERGETVSGYEYDEYTIAVKFYSNLQHDIETNRQNWIETLKSLEFNYNASAVEDMRTALAKQLEHISTIRTKIEELGDAPTFLKLWQFLAAVKDIVEEVSE